MSTTPPTLVAQAAPADDPASLFEGHHQGLKEHIGRLHQGALQSPPDMEAVTEALHTIQAFAEAHFADEEKLMDDVSYTDRAAHGQEHRDFLLSIRRLRETVEDADGKSSEVPGVAALAWSLAQWWESHALNYDRRLVEFMCRGGV